MFARSNLSNDRNCWSASIDLCELLIPVGERRSSKDPALSKRFPSCTHFLSISSMVTWRDASLLSSVQHLSPRRVFWRVSSVTAMAFVWAVWKQSWRWKGKFCSWWESSSDLGPCRRKKGKTTRGLSIQGGTAGLPAFSFCGSCRMLGNLRPSDHYSMSPSTTNHLANELQSTLGLKYSSFQFKTLPRLTNAKSWSDWGLVGDQTSVISSSYCKSRRQAGVCVCVPRNLDQCMHVLQHTSKWQPIGL